MVVGEIKHELKALIQTNDSGDEYILWNQIEEELDYWIKQEEK